MEKTQCVDLSNCLEILKKNGNKNISQDHLEISFYIFLRHLIDRTPIYNKIDGTLITEYTYANEKHLLYFLPNGSFCIDGPCLEVILSPSQYPFFCGLLLTLFQRLANSQYSDNVNVLNAKNLLKLMSSSMIENIQSTLSKKEFIENNDINSLKLPTNKKSTNNLFVIFYSLLNSEFKVKNGRYITHIDGDQLVFESGNVLKFRDSSYFYYIRHLFNEFLQLISSIHLVGDDDKDFIEDDNY